MPQSTPNTLVQPPSGPLQPLEVDADGNLKVVISGGGGGGSNLTVEKDGGGALTSVTTLNFVTGSNITLALDQLSPGVVALTITATGGGGVSFPLVGTPDAVINGATATNSVAAGSAQLKGGDGNPIQSPSPAIVLGGTAVVPGQSGGPVYVFGGQDVNNQQTAYAIFGGNNGIGSGGQVSISGGNGTTANGGLVSITGGIGDEAGGDVNLTAGTSPNTPGNVILVGGNSTLQGGGSIGLQGGQGGAGQAGGGVILNGAFGDNGGPVIFQGGVGSAGPGGRIDIFGGSSLLAGNAGGSINIMAGGANNGADGGNVTIQPGLGDGAGAHGQVLFVNLPNTDPHVVNALWSNAGVLTLSAG
jgi:hypothetical protein